MINRTRNLSGSRMRVRSMGVLALALAACTGPGENREDGPGTDPVEDRPSAAPADYSDLRAEVCADLTNSFECARAIEARQLPDYPGVERSGDTLILALEEGDPVRLVDARGDAADVSRYSYQTRWPEQGLALVQVQYYEGSAYLLVDTTTGERIRLPHRPLLSPDGQHFAVLSFDIEAGYGPNTLQIWDLGDGMPSLEWSVEPDEWGPAEGQWATATTLRFVQRGYCEAAAGPGRDMCESPARVTLDENDGGGWTLVTDG